MTEPLSSSMYRRRLPHWRLTGATYFVTWRLQRGKPDLTPAERALVMAALKHFERARYDLTACVVMNDHVHVVATPLEQHRLDDIVHSSNQRQQLAPLGIVALRHLVHPVRHRLQHAPRLLGGQAHIQTFLGTVPVLQEDVGALIVQLHASFGQCATVAMHQRDDLQHQRVCSQGEDLGGGHDALKEIAGDLAPTLPNDFRILAQRCLDGNEPAFEEGADLRLAETL